MSHRKTVLVSGTPPHDPERHTSTQSFSNEIIAYRSRDCMNILETKRLPSALALVVLLEFNNIVRGATDDFTKFLQRDHGDIFALFQGI